MHTHNSEDVCPGTECKVSSYFKRKFREDAIHIGCLFQRQREFTLKERMDKSQVKK